MHREAKATKAGAKPPAAKAPRGSGARSLAVQLDDALAQQAATAEILRVMADSSNDVQPVLSAIAAQAARLCRAAFARVFLVDGDVIRPLVQFTEAGEIETPMHSMPLTRGSMSGRATLDRAVVHVADIVPLVDHEFPDARENVQSTGFRAALAVPLLRHGAACGAIFLWRREAVLFAPDQVALVETFARQAAIAIESARLFNEAGARNRDLAQALEQQTASGDILRVISQSRTDVQPVFESIVRRSRALCGAAFSGVYLVDGDMIGLAASDGMTPDELSAFAKGYPRKLAPNTVSGRAALECRVVQALDLMTDPQYAGAPGTHVGARTVLGVPLMRNGLAIGSIGVWRAEVEPFSNAQIGLLQTFADQAVIAIENVRLFTELRKRNADVTEALEQQTATSDILRVISSAQRDVQPVFETIAANALRLCDGVFSGVFRFDGELIHVGALRNINPEGTAAFQTAYPCRPSRGGTTQRAILTRSIVHMPDIQNEAEYAYHDVARAAGYRSVLSVPMLREGEPIGTITVYRDVARPFPNVQIELLKTFADQAVIAVENVRLFNALEARTAELTRSVHELRALGDVGQAVSSTLDLETVLSTIVSRAAQLTGMDGGSIYEYDEAREEFHLHTTHRLPAELVEAMRASPIRKGEGALGRMALAGVPVEVPDLLDASSYHSGLRDVLARTGYRSVLAVPLRRDDQLLGGLAVNRKTAGAFDPAVIELLKTFATQSAIAIQNARLFREIETKGRELEAASRHKSEFLANMSHELRTPLNAIIGFSEVLGERLFGELNDKQSEYVCDIADSGRHLLALINDILDLSKIEAGRMELDRSDFDLGKAIGQALSLVRERAQRRAIALDSTVDPRVGVVHADERKVKQVLLNLLSNALKFTPEGGSVHVAAASHDDRVEVAVRDTGVGIAHADQEAVFEEFRQVGASAARTEGTGLGLAISRKFIVLHGGRLWLESEPGKGSTFTFSLPAARPAEAGPTTVL